MEQALYYPFVIPPIEWMKQSLLFFDDISSIVPGRFRIGSLPRNLTHADNQANLLWLQARGLWKPTYIDRLAIPVKELRQAITAPPPGQWVAIDDSDIRLSTVFSDKFDAKLQDWLVDKGLARREVDRLLMPEPVLNAVMSVAVRRIAHHGLNSSSRVVPNTDVRMYWNLAHEPFDADRYKYYELLLDGFLPSPGPTVSLDDVVQFRRAHNDELTAFRVAINELIGDIMKSEQPWDVLHDSRTRIELAVTDVHRAARGRNLRFGVAAISILAGLAGAQFIPLDTIKWMFDGVGTTAAASLVGHIVRGPASTNEMSYLVRSYSFADIVP